MSVMIAPGRVEPVGYKVGFDGLTKPGSFASRKHRCYELASHALAFGTAPKDALLVHGSWHGPGARQRISHAILVLPDGGVWEPITATFYQDFEQFQHWTNWWTERVYTRKEVQESMMETSHYGPWHRTAHP